MYVNVFRAQEWNKVSIHTDAIFKDSVEWTKTIFLNGTYRTKPFYFLKCQVDYMCAVGAGIASGDHKRIASRANIYLYKKDNQSEEFIEGYKYLCELAGPKP